MKKTILLIAVACFFVMACGEKERLFKNKYLLHSLLIEGETPKISVQRPLETYNEYPFQVLYYDILSSGMFEINLENDNESYTEFEIKQVDEQKIKDFSSMIYLEYLTNNDVKIKPGEKYDIRVNIIDESYEGIKILETLQATTNIPEKVEVNFTQSADIITEYESELVQPDTTFIYNISFEDPIETNNYYYLLVYQVDPGPFEIDDVDIDSLWGNYNDLHNGHDTPMLNELGWLIDLSYVEENECLFLRGPLFSDIQFNGKKKEFELKLAKSSFGSGYLFVEFYNLSKEFYNYYYAMIKQNEHQRDIYAEPVQVYSNVENGLGIFAGASVSRKMIKIESKPN